MWKTLTDREKIIAVLEVMASREMELQVLISDQEHEFTSKLITYNIGDPTSEQGQRPELIIEEVSPKEGNALIQADLDLVLEFHIKSLLCRISTRCLGINREYPYGLVLSFPESIEYTERRREERYVYEMPEFVSVDFELRKKGKANKVYSLNVLDCSPHGLGILITQKDFELVEILKPGKELNNISFYTESSVIKVNGIIRHITKIESGKYQGFYLMGVESPEIIEICGTSGEKD
jgi:hypothetical protein